MAEEDKPTTVILKGPIGIRIENEMLTFLQTLIGPQGNPVGAAASGGGVPSSNMNLHAKDPSGDLVIVRSDEQRLLRNRPYEPYRTSAVVDLTGAWATAYTCPANTIDVVTVRFGQTAVGTVNYAVSLRVNGLTVVIGVPVYMDAPPPEFGPYYMAAAEIIEVQRTGGGNGAVSFNIERYSTGDVNTGV